MRVSDVLGPEVEELAADLASEGHEAVAVPFDVADEARRRARSRGGRRAARGARRPRGERRRAAHQARFSTKTPPDFRDVLDVNLVGVFLCLRAAGRLFRRAGLRRDRRRDRLPGGAPRIPRSGRRTARRSSASSGSSRSVARELAADGVRVSAVAPGLIDTADAGRASRAQAAGRDLVEDRAGRAVGRRTPDEVAEAFAFLVVGPASYVSGATVVVDGGECT